MSNYSFNLTRRLCRPLTQAVLTIAFALVIFSQQGLAQKTIGSGDFPLVDRAAADILVSADDFKVVQISAGLFAEDVERIAGLKPRVTNAKTGTSKNVVIIGTLGKSQFIDELASSGKVNVGQIRGKWECFLITQVKNPFPNIDNALVIAGSDRRGTAFGVFEMSQRIGVSPWYWWADVAPEKRENILVSPGTIVGREPSVKYRGIFLNDEDWGLQPWAAKTFEPETGNIGPKTYAKICELLLRLKANTLWPAMHEVSAPFNSIPANRQVADDYGIVMGSSHAEPMLRNNVGEWKQKPEEFNFLTNPAGVTDYWEQRVRENGKFENIYTIGMRGIHDSAIQGPKTQAERIATLEKIFATQRGLLSKYVNPDAEKVPQIFCPYKEVLADYRAGLNVPDDVTIVFPDDNFGYIRQFPSPQEQKRRGGFGVYYHISYLGRPLSYLWLNSTPPAQIFEEMSKAYANGMRNLWIVNVGDIKPGEIGMEFFLQMAYDIDAWRLSNHDQFLQAWAEREFGERESYEIAAIMDKYYRLGFQRKPEHLQWYLPGETPRKSDFTETEALDRLENYSLLTKRLGVVWDRLPEYKRNAFFELVLYPVRSAASANKRFFGAELAQYYKNASPQKARSAAGEAESGWGLIAMDTEGYNKIVASGKWNLIMSPEMKPGQWTSMRSTPPDVSIADYQTGNNTDIHIGQISKELTPTGKPEKIPQFGEVNGIISIETEHFSKRGDGGGAGKAPSNGDVPRAGNLPNAGWMVIEGLGKTGDSVTVFPNIARTYSDIANESPRLEYRFENKNTADYTAYFYLIPTQPLVPGNGLRLAFSIDGGEPQIVTVDKDTEVGSRKWASNILDESTIGTAKVRIPKGSHILRLFAVDTGVVVDKIVLSSVELPKSYFGPPETRLLKRPVR